MDFNHWIMNRIIHSRLYPHIYFFCNPFKIYEFYALMKDADCRATDFVLDLGCGHGLQTNLIGKSCQRIIGIDPNPNTVRRAQSEQHLVAGRIQSEFRITTIEDAGFTNDTFDKIFSVCVLEHIPDDRSALRECLRVLKPGGALHMSVDSLATLTNQQAIDKHSTQYIAHRYYRPDAIRAMLVETGFADIVVEPILSSNVARDLFTDWIMKDVTYRYREAVAWYRRLVRAEKQCDRKDKGIYLIVRARKPTKV